MSFKAKLLINNEERTVLNIAQSFTQIADITGNPEGEPYGDPLFLTIESTGNDNFFYEKMFDPHQTIQGEVIFYKRDGFSTLYKLEFANAYILGLEENFDAYSTMPLHINLKIGWGIIKINGVLYQEKWNTYNPYKEVEVTRLKEQKKEVTNYYLTDVNGNEIQGYDIDDIITLNIETKNRIGDVITVNLNDKEFDFEYHGIVLKNDILKNIKIENDLEQIELKVIVPKN